MNSIEVKANGKNAYFSTKSLTMGDKEYLYTGMSNIKHSAKRHLYLFQYEGNWHKLQYEEKDEKTLQLVFSKVLALQAKRAAALSEVKNSRSASGIPAATVASEGSATSESPAATAVSQAAAGTVSPVSSTGAQAPAAGSKEQLGAAPGDVSYSPSGMAAEAAAANASTDGYGAPQTGAATASAINLEQKSPVSYTQGTIVTGGTIADRPAAGTYAPGISPAGSAEASDFKAAAGATDGSAAMAPAAAGSYAPGSASAYTTGSAAGADEIISQSGNMATASSEQAPVQDSGSDTQSAAEAFEAEQTAQAEGTAEAEKRARLKKSIIIFGIILAIFAIAAIIYFFVIGPSSDPNVGPNTTDGTQQYNDIDDLIDDLQ